MRILITTTQVPFIRGGAEIHAESLRDALNRQGHQAEIVSIPFKWYPPEQILDTLFACRMLDLSESTGTPVDRVIGLKFPAYHVRHPNKVLWILHQHRSAFDLWESPGCDLAQFPNGNEVRTAIDAAERSLLHEAKALYANSQNVANRLLKYSGFQAQPLYHPPKNAEKFHTRDFEDFLFFPSRICELKRQALVIEALAHTKHPVRVVFCGQPEHPDILKRLEHRARELKVDSRINWLGGVDDATLIDTYARTRAVIYPPKDEDFGYVTLEAFLSGKPVVTCTDSGGPLEFVQHEHNGLISDPDPDALAKALDRVWIDPAFAREAGAQGRQHVRDLDITWENVTRHLLEA